MKLYTININQLSYLDSGQFIVRYLTDYQNSGLDHNTDPDFKVLHESLMTQSPLFNAALMQVRAKAESQELIVLDVARDKKITTLRRAHSVFEHSDDANERAAYGLIKTVLTTYKGIERANFEAESLGIDNLVAELRNSTYLGAIHTLGLEGHLNNMETANRAFKDKFNARSTDTITTVVYDTKALRKNILDTYKELAEYVLIMAKRRNTTYYKDSLTIVNNGREYFANILARHNSGSVEAPPSNP